MNKICFIVGHGKSKNGGYDSGAVSKDGKFHEFKIAKKIAKYAQTYYNATYVEQADCMNYDGDLYLSDRIKKVNASNYDFIAEIHLNAGGGTGTECYYSKGSSKGQKYADVISKQIAADLDVKQRSNGKDDGGDKTKLNSSGSDYFGIIRQTESTAVLIETVFIDTASDLAKVNTLEGQKKCGVAIAKAVAEVRGAKKKAVANSATTTKPSTTASTSLLYRVQVGAYSDTTNAKKQLDKVKKAGFEAIVVKVDKLYKVQVGAYKELNNAKAMLAKVEKAGFRAFITAVSGEVVSVDATETDSFFPARGYFKKGDVSPNVGKIAAFMRKMFPSYTPSTALGNLYGDNLIKAIKEFQRRTGLEADGFFGPKTLAKLKSFGFKE